MPVYKNYPSLTKKEQIFIKKNEDLIHCVVSCYDCLIHGGAKADNSTMKHVMNQLENAVGKTLIKKMVCRAFWDSCAEASKEVATWPEWKRAR